MALLCLFGFLKEDKKINGGHERMQHVCDEQRPGEATGMQRSGSLDERMHGKMDAFGTHGGA